MSDDLVTGQELVRFAAWWTGEMVANEVEIDPPAPLPSFFRDLVAMNMVSDPKMGWPDVPSALFTLDELGHGSAPVSEGGEREK